MIENAVVLHHEDAVRADYEKLARVGCEVYGIFALEKRLQLCVVFGQRAQLGKRASEASVSACLLVVGTYIQIFFGGKSFEAVNRDIGLESVNY